MSAATLEYLFRPQRLTAFAVMLAFSLSLVQAAIAADQESSREDEMKQQRIEAQHQQRRLIFNNDGNEAFLFPKDQELTPENVLAMRTTPLIGSNVDTIFYCTVSAGFGLFSHNTQVGEILTVERFPGHRDGRNITEELIAQGRDILEIMVDFAREHDKEIFWSMRMNDDHDRLHRPPDNMHPLFPKLKEEHPEYLMGARSNGGLPGYIGWTGVDYTHPEIRDLAFRYIEEVCKGYDVDGVELDFFRAPVLFKSHAWGNEVTDEERGALTEFMRRVHKLTEEVSLDRGRPLLISIRVPDSVEYCHAIGIDLEQWLKEGLTDLLVVGGDFYLAPWEESVALGRKYNVPVYPSLTNTAGKRREVDRGRNTPEGWRGRAMNAWSAGADGIYLFNVYHPDASQLRELSDPATLEKLDKVYYGVEASVERTNRHMPDGLRFRSRPTLSPDYPEAVLPGRPVATTLTIGEDVLSGKQEGRLPTLTLGLHVDHLDDVQDLVVTLNGHELDSGRLSEEWAEFTPEPEWLRKGSNDIEIALRDGREGEPEVRDLRLVVVYKTTSGQ